MFSRTTAPAPYSIVLQVEYRNAATSNTLRKSPPDEAVHSLYLRRSGQAAQAAITSRLAKLYHIVAEIEAFMSQREIEVSMARLSEAERLHTISKLREQYLAYADKMPAILNARTAELGRAEVSLRANATALA